MLAEVVKINLFDYDETSIAKCLPYPSLDKLNHTQSCELLEVQTLCHQLGSQNAIQLQIIGIQVTSPAQHSSDELRRTSMLWLRSQACQCCQNLIGNLLHDLMNTHAGFQKQDSPHIVVLGAGAIGGYIGGCLAVAGAHLSFLGRSKMQHIVKTHGYNLTDLYGRHAKLEPTEVQFTTDPSVLQKADCVLVTVKSRDTLAAADLLRTHANPNAIIISFQNGIGNAEALANQLPHFQVIAGMVPFNVVTLPNGHLHCGTEGQLCTESNALLSPLILLFEKAGLPLQQHAHFKEIQWGKLILNLNNAVNALSDLPLKEELSQRAYRQCLALLISETLTVLNLAGIHPAKVSKVSAKLLPYILRTPDFVFKRLAASMLQIDEKARSSMWEDLQNQRTTEVTALNGAVVDLAKSIGVSAPVNARMVTLVQQAEKGLLKALSGRALLQTLKQVPLAS